MARMAQKRAGKRGLCRLRNDVADHTPDLERRICMKSTGIVRKVDELGRIVLPIELRKSMDIDKKGDAVEIFIDDDRIILKKYQPACIFCDSSSNVISFEGKRICEECLAKLKNI